MPNLTLPDAPTYKRAPREEWTPPAYGSDLNLWDYKLHSAIWSITDKSGYAWGPGEFSRRLRAIIQERTWAIQPLDDTDLVFSTATDRLRALCAVLDQIEGANGKA